MLRLVLIRVSPRGLSPRGRRRPVYLDIELYLLLSACFSGLVDDIRGWLDSSEYWFEAYLGPISCFL